MTAGEGPRVLLVEDDRRVARAIAREIAKRFELVTCSSLADALFAMAGRESFMAAIFDVGLPDGSGLRALEALRTRVPEVPALVLTGAADHQTVAEVQRLGAQFLLKPFDASNLHAFLDRALKQWEGPGRLMEERVRSLAERRGLSDREREVVLMAARGVPSSLLHERMGISPNTAKTLIRRAIRKCDVGSIGELVGPLQEEILSGGSMPASASTRGT